MALAVNTISSTVSAGSPLLFHVFKALSLINQLFTNWQLIKYL